MTDDRHSPTTAGPTPQAMAATAGEATGQQPAGAGPTDGAASVASRLDTNQRPELLVGAAFAGGYLAALILKRLAE